MIITFILQYNLPNIQKSILSLYSHKTFLWLYKHIHLSIKLIKTVKMICIQNISSLFL